MDTLEQNILVAQVYKKDLPETFAKLEKETAITKDQKEDEAAQQWEAETYVPDLPEEQLERLNQHFVKKFQRKSMLSDESNRFRFEDAIIAADDAARELKVIGEKSGKPWKEVVDGYLAKP